MQMQKMQQNYIYEKDDSGFEITRFMNTKCSE